MSATEKRLRLVSLAVTPNFVVEDGDTLEPFTPEHDDKPVEITLMVSAKAWANYAAEGWPEAVEQITEQFLADD